MQYLDSYIREDYKDFHTEANLIDIYYKYLLNLLHSPYEFVWLHPNELKPCSVKSWSIVKDRYLKSTENCKEKLGLDILENGTYWPFTVDEENGQYVLREGIHRLYSIQSLYEKNIWPKEKRLLFINRKKQVRNANKLKFFYIPNFGKKEFEKNYSYIYLNEKLNRRPSNNKNFDIITAPAHMSYMICTSMSLLLRNEFFKYTELTGNKIKGLSFINDEKIFNKIMHQYDIKQYNNKQYDIDMLYNHYYIDTLKKMPFELEWITIDENIKIDNVAKRISPPWNNQADLFINKYKDNKINLAKNIILNGTYWPLIGYKKDNDIYLLEGLHRYEALMLAKKEKLWNNKKMLFLNIPKHIHMKYLKDDKCIAKENIFVPIFKKDNFNRKDMKDFLDKVHNFNEGFEELNNIFMFKYKPQELKEYVIIYQSYTTILRGYFFKEMERNNFIKPNIIINKKSVYDEWIKSQEQANSNIKTVYQVEKNSLQGPDNSFSHIRKVEIELQSYCNRKCNWCPNKELDRTFHKELDEHIFLNILKELKENNFATTNNFEHYVISFSGFNEPMSNIDLLKKRTKQIKKYFNNNKIKLATNTNGDYLTKENLDDLSLDLIAVMDYDNRGKDYYLNKCKEIGIELIEDYKNRIVGKYNDIELTFSIDWPKKMLIENQGGILNTDCYYHDKKLNKDIKMNWKNNKNERKIKCRHPLYFIVIDYEGNVKPCCHIRADYDKHKPFIMGNLHENTLKDIYYSEKFKKFRQGTFNAKYKEYGLTPCLMCQKPDDYFVRFIEKEI